MQDSITTGLVPSRPTLIIDYGSCITSAVMALPKTDRTLWPKAILDSARPVEAASEFLKTSGLPAPELTLICSMQTADQEEHCMKSRADRILRWKRMLAETKGRPEYFLREAFPGWEIDPLLVEARKTFGTALGTDSGMAAVLAALSIASLRERSWSEGVTVIWAGYRHVQAFMVFQERLLGLYEQHSDISREAFLKDLDEMRLNWLPDEQVRAQGGHGCICGDLPEEAEGFRPTWILGPCREKLKGYGRLSSPCNDDRFDRAAGMLFGLALRQNA